MHRLVKAIILLSLITLVGCGANVPIIKIDEVPSEILQSSYSIQVYTVDSTATRPKVKSFIGQIDAFSCKLLSTDPPASKGDALTQLRLNALEKGATGVVDVTFDLRGADAWGTNCWESVQASGVAVIFE